MVSLNQTPAPAPAPDPDDPTLDELLLDLETGKTQQQLRELLNAMWERPLMMAMNESCLSVHQAGLHQFPGLLVFTSARAMLSIYDPNLLLNPSPKNFVHVPGHEIFSKLVEHESDTLGIHLLGPNGLHRQISGAVIKIFVESKLKEELEAASGNAVTCAALMKAPDLVIEEDFPDALCPELKPWEICGAATKMDMTLADWVTACQGRAGAQWIPDLVDKLLKTECLMSTKPVVFPAEFLAEHSISVNRIIMIYSCEQALKNPTLLNILGGEPEIEFKTGGQAFDKLLTYSYSHDSAGWTDLHGKRCDDSLPLVAIVGAEGQMILRTVNGLLSFGAVYKTNSGMVWRVVNQSLTETLGHLAADMEQIN